MDVLSIETTVRGGSFSRWLQVAEGPSDILHFRAWKGFSAHLGARKPDGQHFEGAVVPKDFPKACREAAKELPSGADLPYASACRVA